MKFEQLKEVRSNFRTKDMRRRFIIELNVSFVDGEVVSRNAEYYFFL